jgi:Tfp pilus assembly PilM family ATPase
MIAFNRACVGVDTGARSLKAAWITKGRDSGSLTLERQPGDEHGNTSAFRRLAEALSRRGVKNPYVGLIVPDDLLCTSVVDVPSKSSPAPRVQIAIAEFHRQLGLVQGEYDAVVTELPTHVRKDSGECMLVNGLNREASEQLCASAVTAGLDLVYMTTPSNALVAAMPIQQVPQGGEVTPILDLGWTSARIVLSCGGRVLFRRAIPELGIKSLMETIADARHADLAVIEAALNDSRQGSRANRVQLVQPALSKWIPRCIEDVRAALSYAHHRYPSNSFGVCVCVGGGTQLPGVLDALASQATFQVIASSYAPATDSQTPCLHAAHGMAVLLRNALAQSRRAA